MIEQLRRVWSNLSAGQKTAAIAISIAVFAGVLVATSLAGEPDFVQLATGLAAKDLEAVIGRLAADGIERYKIVGSGTVLVDAAEVDRARAALAQGGLLGGASNSSGDDGGLFSAGALNPRDHAVREARKAEARLERILVDTFEFVEVAKVSITPAVKTYYERDRQAAKAAVVVKTRGVLSRHQIESIAHTISGGVTDLSPDDVAISDTRGILLRAPNSGSGGDARAANLAYQAELEAKKMTQAQDQMDRTFGPHKVSVKVSLELDWKRQEIKKREFDPESAVTLDKTKTEHSSSTPQRLPGGRPGVAAVNNGTNAPPAAVADDKSTTVTEQKSYNTVESQLIDLGGTIKRMTVSAVVDESLSVQADAIKKVIANSVGLDETGRGDSIEIVLTKIEAPEAIDIAEVAAGNETLTRVLDWTEKGLYVVLGAAFLFFSLRTIKKAQSNLRTVLEASLEEEKQQTTERPKTLEEEVVEATQKDVDLAGRTLRRWLYEGAGV